MKVEVDQIFHMVGGLGETSYATNSTLQEKAIYKAKTVVQRSIQEVYCNLQPEILISADLGCSFGPTTFMVISEIMDKVHEICYDASYKLPELMFFLNDLPGNDFNTIFKSLTMYEKKVREKMGREDVQFYIVGAPGSFYRRLFPKESVHFVHSSYSLHWLSQVPRGLVDDPGVPINKKKHLHIRNKPFLRVSIISSAISTRFLNVSQASIERDHSRRPNGCNIFRQEQFEPTERGDKLSIWAIIRSTEFFG